MALHSSYSQLNRLIARKPSSQLMKSSRIFSKQLIRLIASMIQRLYLMTIMPSRLSSDKLSSREVQLYILKVTRSRSSKVI